MKGKQNLDPNGLEIREILAIDAVARERSFKLAADALNTSQPTLSRLIATAEKRLGRALFRRGWSGAETTPQGDVVARICAGIISKIDAAQTEIFPEQTQMPTLKHNVRTVQLQVIEAICREGSVTLAAARLGKTQPFVSRVLNEFSKRFQLQLFHRTSKGMKTLAAGQVLGTLSSSITQTLLLLPEQFSNLGAEFAGRVSVGILPFSGQDLVFKAFAAITNEHPSVRLACVPGSYNGLVEALRRNEIDRIVGILRGQACPDGLKEDFLYNERFVVIARKGHPLHVEVPGIDALEQTNWVVAPHGTPVRSYFETVFSDIGASPPTQTCELLSFGYAEQMLEVSNSAAVLTYSDRKLATLRSELAEVRTGFPEQTAQIGVSSLKTAPTNRALNEFDRVLKRLVLEQNHVD